MIQTKTVRILAVAPLTRGFGYAVMEGTDRLVAYGNKVINHDKNIRALAWVEKYIRFYQPDVLVLPDVNAADTPCATHQNFAPENRRPDEEISTQGAVDFRHATAGTIAGQPQGYKAGHGGNSGGEISSGTGVAPTTETSSLDERRPAHGHLRCRGLGSGILAERKIVVAIPLTWPCCFWVRLFS
jgi:hypothetical protein